MIRALESPNFLPEVDGKTLHVKNNAKMICGLVLVRLSSDRVT
jgi:hypothetical protein